MADFAVHGGGANFLDTIDHGGASTSHQPVHLRVLAVFCNPKGTDPLRLQAEQRILQRCLPSNAHTLNVQPAATLDDLREALLRESFDVIHFSGHGCVDAPLQRMLRHALQAQHGLDAQLNPKLLQCLPPAVQLLKRWLQETPPADGAAGDGGVSLTLHPAAASESGRVSLDAPGGGPASSSVPPPEAADGALRIELRRADFGKHRVGSLAFEGASGMLEPPAPDVLAKLLAYGLRDGGSSSSSSGGGGGGGGGGRRVRAVFLNACETQIQAQSLLARGVGAVVYCRGRISDGAAAEFSRGFYEALARGRAVGEAYEQGQIAVELRYDTEQHGCPHLLQRPPDADADQRPQPTPAAAAGHAPHAWPRAAPGADGGGDGGGVGAPSMLETFDAEACAGAQAPLQELVPMHGSERMALCDSVPRMVRDSLGGLHSLGTLRVQVPVLEAALPIPSLLRDPHFYRRVHRLLGRVHELRVTALNHLAQRQLAAAAAQLVHALELVRSLSAALASAAAAPDGEQPAAAAAAADTDAAAAPEPAAAAAAAAESVVERRASSSSSAAAPAEGALATPAGQLPVYPQLQVRLGEADTRLSLAVVYAHMGAAAASAASSSSSSDGGGGGASTGREHAECALAIYRALNADAQAAAAQTVLAELHSLHGDHPGAEEHLRGALRESRELGCGLGEAEALRALGVLRVAVGDESGGQQLLCEAAHAFRRVRSAYGVRVVTRLLGGAAADDGADGGGATSTTASLLAPHAAPRRVPFVRRLLKPKVRVGGRGARRGGGGASRKELLVDGDAPPRRRGGGGWRFRCACCGGCVEARFSSTLDDDEVEVV